MEQKISTSTKVMSGCLLLLPLCHVGYMLELGRTHWLDIAGLLYTSWLAWNSVSFLRTQDPFYKTLEDIGFQAYLGVGVLIRMVSSGFQWFLALASLLALTQLILSVSSLARAAEIAKQKPKATEPSS